MKIRGALKCLLFAAAAAAALAAQQAPGEILDHASRDLLHSVNRMAGLVATITMDRKYSEPLVARPLHSCDDVAAQQRSGHWRLHLASSDVVRADLLIGAANDAYSWAGENRFDDPGLESILIYGSWSVGELAGMPHMIFSGQDSVDFDYDGDRMQGGRLVSEFEFHANAEASHYSYKVSGLEWKSAYEGKLLADPETGELVQITLRSIGLPAATGTCEVEHTFDYARVAIAGEPFLLPAQVLIRYSNPNGTESDNRVTYSNFRRTESQPVSAMTASAAPPALPVGVPFMLELMQPIDLANARFGDHVQGAIVTGIKDREGNTVVPENSPVDGRIIKLLKVYGKTESFWTWSVIVRWYTLTHDGITHAFTADLMPPGTVFDNYKGSVMIARAPPDKASPGETLLPNQLEPGRFGAIGAKPDFVFPRGALSIWKTVSP